MTHSPLPASGFIRQADLIGKPAAGKAGFLPFSSATLWRKVKAGEFPKPVKLSERVTAWALEDVHAWAQARRAA